MIVRGRLDTVARMAFQASGGIGVVRRKEGMECSESEASLHTQLGEEGQGDKCLSVTPKLFGRSPEKEKRGMRYYKHYNCECASLF
jgi:hypothetical protein